MVVGWKNWCRLCANTRATVKVESVQELNSIIFNNFQMTLSETANMSLFICKECDSFVAKLIGFKERCAQANHMFIYLCGIPKIPTQELEEIRGRYLGAEGCMDDIMAVVQALPDELDAEEPKLLSIIPKSECEDTEEPVNEMRKSLEASELDGNDAEKDANSIGHWDADEIENNSANVADCYSDSASIDERQRQRQQQEKGLLADVEILTDAFISLEDQNLTPYTESLAAAKLRKSCKRRLPTEPARRTLQCEICLRTFRTAGYLKKHEITHLPVGEKRLFRCNFCDKTFTKALNVKEHIRLVHDGQKPFICEECGKPFGSKGALKEHHIVHTEERPFLCAQCPKRFKNAARLKTHEDTHNRTLYVCPHCGLNLNTKRTLNMHMLVHSDQKKHKCQYCGNEFKRSKALKAHLILHTGLRPYQCPFCDKTFANGSNCRSHKKKFHPLELEALEAQGGQKPAANIPKLQQLLQPAPSNAEHSKSIEQVVQISCMTQRKQETADAKRLPMSVSPPMAKTVATNC